jgi:hypothetical protein
MISELIQKLKESKSFMDQFPSLDEKDEKD